jgi:putative hydrolase of the HAD superfamily
LIDATSDRRVSVGIVDRSSADLPEAVLFDFDGTLVDTESVLLTSWMEEYALAGHELSARDWAEAAGQERVDHYARLSSLVGPAFDVQACRTRRRRRQTELLESETLRPGIVETLNRCSELGVRTAVVSSAPLDWVEEQLAPRGVLGAFDALISREDAVAAKPHPDLYLVALARLGVSAARAIAVEDAANGAQAALAAGVLCLVVPNDVTKDSRFPGGTHRLPAGADLWSFLIEVWKTGR